MLQRALTHPLAKPVLWLLLAWPGTALLWAGLQNELGANPVEALVRGLGDWTLRLLCLTLAVAPLRRLSGWSGVLRFRRNLGVATFVYASTHWLAYAVLDQSLDLAALWHDVVKRPFILVGTAAWLALLPLAATSFNGAVRWMGARAWLDLHKLTYAVAGTAWLHFLWMKAGKNDFAEVTLYGLVLATLLGERLWRRA